jgi:hypothetical protein
MIVNDLFFAIHAKCKTKILEKLFHRESICTKGDPPVTLLSNLPLVPSRVSARSDSAQNPSTFANISYKGVQHQKERDK